MKKLQMLLFVALILFTYSCTDDTPTKPAEKETNSIELIATDGLEINKSLADLPMGDTELLASFHTQIKNNGPRDIKVWAKMEIVEIANSQKTYFCWGDLASGNGICYEPTTEDFTSKSTLDVKAGETTPPGNFINYMSNESIFGGTSKIRYIVYEDENIENRDTVIYTINFN